MAYSSLQNIIEDGWMNFATSSNQSALKQAVTQTLDLLDRGEIRVSEKHGDAWQTNEWMKKAILLSFKLNDSKLVQSSIDAYNWFDKVPLKFTGWDEGKFKQAGFRAVPGSIVRHSAFIDKGVVIMPSFINVGAYVGAGTMIDTWVTVGSCAQIGKNCHISGGVGIGGVLEPIQSSPVIIEDNCFIGARSEIAEGVIVKEGAVISMGVFICATTKIIDRASGRVFYGEVPPYSVVVSGVAPGDGSNQPLLNAAIIVKTVDERTRSKTSINEILRL